MPRSAEAKSTFLRFDTLEEGLNAVRFEIEAEELELSDPSFGFPRPLRVAFSVFRSSEMFTVNGSIQLTLSGECCRCLAAVEKTLEVPLHLLLQRKQATAEELAATAEDEEVEILDLGVREVDLGPYLREMVLVELPMRIYCRDDCKGLCPHCGRDLNEGSCRCSEDRVDLRWIALKKVRFS